LKHAHLGDETWKDVLGDDWGVGNIDHKRPPKGTARMKDS
jgi:hypothetical protein